MKSLKGLERLESVGRLQVYGNTVLTSFEALESLRVIEGVAFVVRNPSLQTLGLRALESVGQLEIGGSQETLGQFPDSGPICETGNPSLTELGSLESLVEFQEITIGQNQNLGSIEELRGLAERIGMKPDGEIPRIMLNENERLPIDHIRDVLQDGHDGGAYRLETYCNEGEEACESWCH